MGLVQVEKPSSAASSSLMLPVLVSFSPVLLHPREALGPGQKPSGNLEESDVGTMRVTGVLLLFSVVQAETWRVHSKVRFLSSSSVSHLLSPISLHFSHSHCLTLNNAVMDCKRYLAESQSLEMEETN